MEKGEREQGRETKTKKEKGRRKESQKSDKVKEREGGD